MKKTVNVSPVLEDVRYEIRGALANRAQELERQGYEITKLNIGNPGQFGFRTPETMRLAMIENLRASEAYCHQKGIFPAREAVVMQQQDRGVEGVTAEHVFIGNGVSELIDLTLRALLAPGDEVLVPAPDYPLWTAATLLNGGVVRHYPCRPDEAFIPDVDAIEALITPKTRALVVINPNNPTGAVYPVAVLDAMVALAERHNLVILSDEIYDQMLYDDVVHVPLATRVDQGVCITFSGLSKVYRACGYRVGWAVVSGDLEAAADYLHALELLASLRLCANVPAQWAVQTALGGYQSITELTRPPGRLHASRAAVIDAVADSPFLKLVVPQGAMYAFVGVDTDRLPAFNDYAFALDLLEHQHVLVAPGGSFNVPYSDHFRITLLPRANSLHQIFGRINAQLESLAQKDPSLVSVTSSSHDVTNPSVTKKAQD
ncbi:MAG: aminotransferase class I/II-fold pyridoxal phosphate-dependent enzyme [Pseudomonadota bacterium]